MQAQSFGDDACLHASLLSLLICIAEVNDRTAGAAELDRHLHRRAALDRLSVAVKSGQVRIGGDGEAKALVANCEVDYAIRANRLGRDALKLHHGRVITAIDVADFRRCEAAISVRVRLNLDASVDTRQGVVEVSQVGLGIGADGQA